jgi:hypothetical protein
MGSSEIPLGTFLEKKSLMASIQPYQVNQFAEAIAFMESRFSNKFP